MNQASSFFETQLVNAARVISVRIQPIQMHDPRSCTGEHSYMALSLTPLEARRDDASPSGSCSGPDDASPFYS